MDKCKNSCCIGWQIVVDEVTESKYGNLKTELGDILRESVICGDDGERCFKTDCRGRCTHLDGSGLCRIISDLSESYIPDICDRHPRYYNLYPCVKEGGLGLSCEGAVDIFLKKPLAELMARSISEKERLTEEDFKISMYSDECVEKMLDIRERIFDFVLSESFIASVWLILNFGDKVIHASDLSDDFEAVFYEIFDVEAESCASRGALSQLISEITSALELNSEWLEKVLDNVNKNIHNLLSDLEVEKDAGCDELGRKLLFYFLHRYMLGGLDSGTVGARLKFSACLCVMLMCAVKSSGVVADVIRQFSSSVEYSEENIEALIELMYQ